MAEPGWWVLAVRARPLPDGEGGEAFRGFGLDGYVVDRGQAGAGMGPVDQAADSVGRPLEDRFDPAVGQVAHPARHAVLLGQAAARVAEEDTLDPARDQHPIAHHKAEGTPRTIRPAVGLVPRRVLYVIPLVA